jgi:ubiquinone biosynthesis protein
MPSSTPLPIAVPVSRSDDGVVSSANPFAINLRHVWRMAYVAWFLGPFLISFLRDRKRYVKWGAPREMTEERHAQRAKKLVDTFARLGTSYIKLSQILAVREDLIPKVYAQEFARLLDQTPAASVDYVSAVVRKRIGKSLGEAFDDFRPQSIASASIGQVHRARYRGADVVVKIRRPNVVEIITLDNAIMGALMNLMRPFFGEHYLYRGFEVLFQEYKRIVVGELDFRIEERNAERLRAQQPKHPRLIIPEIVSELTHEDLLVMEFCEGVRIDQVETIRQYGVDLEELVESLLEILFSQLLVHGFFHADPHPGNILINRQGQIILLDYGMVDELDPTTRDHFLGLILSAHANQFDEVVNKLYALEMVDPQAPQDALRHVTESIMSLRHLARINQRQVQRAVEELFEKTRILHHLRMPRQMVYLLRMATLIEGVAIRFDNNFDTIRDAVPIAKRVGFKLIARIVPIATALRYAAEVFAERVDNFLGKLMQRKKVSYAKNFVRQMTHRLRNAPPPHPPSLPAARP